jgi:uroporphyrinogen-III synthase
MTMASGETHCASRSPSSRSGSPLADGTRDGVLITRPQPGAAETAARVAALGLRPVVAPLLEIRPLPANLPAPDRLQAILIASGNALPGLPADYHRLKLLAVGEASAIHARAAGFTQVLSADGDAEALATLASTHCTPNGLPLLLAVGRGQSLTLAAALRARDFRVIRRAVYVANPVRALPDQAIAALRAQSLGAALFFSAETARQFVRLLIRAGLGEAVREIDACAIGQPAATAIEALPWRRVLRAAKPTQDAMLALLR